MTNPMRHRGLPSLPDEIAFLLGYGISTGVLRAAAFSARATGVTADVALLNTDALSA